MNTQDISPMEKFCPRVQSGLTFPDVRSLVDKTFFIRDNKDVQDFYITYKGDYVKLNITKYDTLEVDTIIAHNLFADKFTMRQTTFQNGDLMVSDGGVVEAVDGTTITFKDTTGFNVCAFQVGDLIEAHTVNADTKLAITNPQGTVTSVLGKQITITYNSTSDFRVGDEVYRVGNSSDATRQDSLYFSTNRANTPYFAIYDNISSWDTVVHPTIAWTTATPKILIGNGKSLNASYKHGIYIQDGGELIVSPSATVSGLLTLSTTYTSGTTFPSTPNKGDWHFYTKTPADPPYTYNTWYQWSGSAWVNFGIIGTYIDSTGVYTGTVQANKIIAGSGIINALSILSTLTVGSASTDGYIQSYGWDGTVNGFQIKGGATPTFTTIGGSIIAGAFKSSGTMTYDRGVAGTEGGYWLGKYGTGDFRLFIGSSATKYFKYDNTDLSFVGGTWTAGTIQTATTAPKIVINGSNNSIEGYSLAFGGLKSATIKPYANKVSNTPEIWQNGMEFFVYDGSTDLSVMNLYTITLGSALFLNINANTIIGTYFSVNNSGQLTEVNHVPAFGNTGYGLISDGTSFTPTATVNSVTKGAESLLYTLTIGGDSVNVSGTPIIVNGTTLLTAITTIEVV